MMYGHLGLSPAKQRCGGTGQIAIKEKVPTVAWPVGPDAYKRCGGDRPNSHPRDRYLQWLGMSGCECKPARSVSARARNLKWWAQPSINGWPDANIRCADRIRFSSKKQ